MRVLITGGAGFIGSALTRRLIERSDHEVLVVDRLAYAGRLENLAPISKLSRFQFVKADIGDAAAMAEVLQRFAPDIVSNLAAQTHVDRSIDGPDEFIKDNILGAYTLLQAALKYWRGLRGERAERFRFHHISTDEVFGSLPDEGLFTEETRYDPRSPYSASKAASDHLVSAWGHTFGLPTIVTNCSNNYGPYQFPEKLIPLMVIRALSERSLPVYGAGDQVRDWLYVDDHAEALQLAFETGRPGRSYNVGGDGQRTNLAVVQGVCDLLDQRRPRTSGSYRDLIAFVQDRPGHDRRYAIDASRIRAELGWRPRETFEAGLARTVDWYIANEAWWRAILDQGHDTERIGLMTRT